MASHLFFILVLSLVISLTSALPTIPVASRPYYFGRCSEKPRLVCVLKPTAGNNVSGVVTYTSVFNPSFRFWDWRSRRCHVRITATVRNLTPGPHGFHIHAYGDDRSTDATSTGGHFLNPQFRPVKHGLPFNSQRHWGDFGNIIAAPNGVGTLNVVNKRITIRGVVGRGMVVHAGADKGADEQPSGASGPRQASCVIGFANPKL